jgi:RNA-directed DNA polymerase
MMQRPESFYTAFRLLKRKGGSRPIDAPHRELKVVQLWLHKHVTRKMAVHDAAHGFRSGRSIVTNAGEHAGRGLVLKYDIKDFFPAVATPTVFRLFRRVGYSRGVAGVLAHLTTLRGVLPQGAPTSPDLANVAAFRLDARLSALAKRRAMTYTRYADDLTFSGSNAGDPRFRRLIEHIMRDSGFPPNERKTALASHARQQRVTGIIVNDRACWPRVTRRWLRQEVYYLRRYGVEGHLRRRGYDFASYREFLYGHIYALRQLHPREADEALESLAAVVWPY